MDVITRHEVPDLALSWLYVEFEPKNNGVLRLGAELSCHLGTLMNILDVGFCHRAEHQGFKSRSVVDLGLPISRQGSGCHSVLTPEYLACPALLHFLQSS